VAEGKVPQNMPVTGYGRPEAVSRPAGNARFANLNELGLDRFWQTQPRQQQGIYNLISRIRWGSGDATIAD
jgi:hypothetical protein